MRSILITGSSGFIGRSLSVELARRADVRLLRHDIHNTGDELRAALDCADVIIHLAGINRPLDPAEFETGNAGLTQEMCSYLMAIGRAPRIVLSSSIQAALDNPYGVSKRHAEDEVRAYAAATGAEVSIYRLPNVFGMGCRPNYNSAVATFCHNIAHDLPVQVSDPAREMELVYIDDVVEVFLREVEELSVVGCQLSVEEELKRGAAAQPPTDNRQPTTSPLLAPTYRVTLGRIVEMLESFRRSRKDLQIPDQADAFSKKLYATYLSYLPTDKFSYPLKMNVDERGSFTEFLKSPERGQVSINISKPSITKGNHWHHTKNEKFLVVSGRGVIRFRKVRDEELSVKKTQDVKTHDAREDEELSVVSCQLSVEDKDELKRGADALQTSDNRQPTTRLTAEESSVVSGQLSVEEELKRGADALPTTDNRQPTTLQSDLLEYYVSGEKLEVVDIPPGYTHNIENLGDTDMVTVMWANEPFDPTRPDTVFEAV